MKNRDLLLSMEVKTFSYWKWTENNWYKKSGFEHANKNIVSKTIRGSLFGCRDCLNIW